MVIRPANTTLKLRAVCMMTVMTSAFMGAITSHRTCVQHKEGQNVGETELAIFLKIPKDTPEKFYTYLKSKQFEALSNFNTKL